MIRRRAIEEEAENHDRWLVSYADFITLLFAFFVVMYGISSVNQKKYNQLSSAIGSAFSSQTSQNTSQGNPKHILRGQRQSFIKPLPLSHMYEEKLKRERESVTRVGIQLADTLSGFIQDGKIRVVQNNEGIRIDINDKLLFLPGSADLSSHAEALIAEIADVLAANRRVIQVEGHTDNIPIHNARFYSNWELSALRASTVVRTLITHGITPQRLSATGFGDTQPVGDNQDETGRASNRRVSMLIQYELPETSSNGSETQPTPMAEDGLEIRPQGQP